MGIETVCWWVGDGLDKTKRNEEVEDVFDFFVVVGAGVVGQSCTVAVCCFGDRICIFLWIISASSHF